MNVLDNTEKNYNGKSLESVLVDGYEFKLGDFLGRGAKLFASDAGSYIGYLLVMAVISIAASFVPFIGSFLSIILGPVLTVGWYYYGQLHNTGKDKQFSNFFDGFKNPPWMQLVLASIMSNLIVLIAMAVVIIPAGSIIGWENFEPLKELMNTKNPDEVRALYEEVWSGQTPLVIFLASIMALLVSTLYVFAPMFIIFRGMTFWDAMEASRMVISKKYPQFLVFLVVLGFLMLLGGMLCFVGLLAAVPIVFLSIYTAFEGIMGTGEATYL